MKRLYSLLVTVIMMITAATTVSAKDYYSVSENYITEIEDGMTVVIKGSFKGKYAQGAGCTSSVSSDCLFKLTKVGSVDGLDVYNVQHVNSGKYLKGGELTSDQTTATKWYIEQAVGYETNDEAVADPIHGTMTSCQGNPVEWEGAFIFCDSENTANTLAIYYDDQLTCWGYRDTNALYLYGYEIATGRNRADLMMQDLFPNQKPIAEVFAAGNNMGQVPAEYYDALVAARNAIDKILYDGEDHTDAEYEAAADALEAAYEACAANLIPAAPGFYRFRTIRPNFETGYAYTNAGIIKWRDTTYTIPETLTADDAAYIWEFTKAPKTDGGFYIRNVRANKYVNYESKGETSQKLEDEPSTVWYIVNSPANPLAFAFRSGDDMAQGMHAAMAAKTVVRWSYSDMGSGWFVEAVDPAEVEALVPAVEQALINDKLSSLFSDATGDYEVGNVRLPIAKEMTGNDLWTNAQESQEGPIANAVDKNEDGTPNYGTFFHTSWSNQGMAAIHNFCADLGDAYKELQIQITDRANANTYNRPTIVDIYGANEIAEGDSLAGDSWHYAGRFNVAYNDTVMFNGSELGVGKVTAFFAVPYRYIRMDAVQVKNNNDVTTRFFTASNIAFANEIDEEHSLNSTIPSEYTAPLAAAIQKAVTEIAAGAATEATYNELKEAYELYLSAYPDPDVLAALLEDVRAVAANISSEQDAPGYFDASFDTGILQGKIDEVAEAISGNDIITYADNRAYTNTLNGILREINAAVKRPEAGMYRITSQSTNANIFGNMVYAGFAGKSDLWWSGSAASTDFMNDLRGIWYMTVNEDNTVTLRNMFSGYYMGKNESGELSQPISVSKEPVNIELQYSGTPGAFNLVQSEMVYMNTDPVGKLVTWNTRGDNSLFVFNSESNNPWEGAHVINVDATCPNIVTMPFPVLNQPMGGAYAEIVGINRNAGTLELRDYVGGTIPAGTPFVIMPDETPSTLLVIDGVENSVEELLDVEYTDKATTVNGLVGTLETITTENRELKFATLDNAPIVSYLDANSTIAAATGYISTSLLPETTEDADYHVAIHANVLTGVQNVANNAAKKQAVYDLSGRRVQKLQKGLYIVNGKKVLVK